MKVSVSLLLTAAVVALSATAFAQEGLPPLPPGVTPPPGGMMGPPRSMPPGGMKSAARDPNFGDLAYGAASPAQKLDIYLPKGPGPFPVVVYIHGGAFKFGGKREPMKEFADDIAALNAKGIAVASIDYRMSGEATYPAAVTDAKLAVRWLKANAKTHRLDGRVGVWGKSAGAYLALMITTTGGTNAPGGDADYGDLSSQDDAVAGVVAMYPPVQFLKIDEDLTAAGCPASAANHNAAGSPESAFMGAQLPTIADKVNAASPLSYLNASAPPALIMVGTADCMVSPGQGTRMADAYKTVVGPDKVTLRVVEGGKHADPIFDQGDNLAAVASFFASLFK
jgi:acetyl esterase/lipase